MNIKFARRCIKRCQKMGCRIMAYMVVCDLCTKGSLWASLEGDKEEDSVVPSDVPMGHLVVYVGEYHKRFVIRLTLLKHPLFLALLDRAQDVYGFAANTRLCIPCDESIFLRVVQCAKSGRSQPLSVCIRRFFCNSCY